MTDDQRDRILGAALLKHRRAVQTRNYLRLVVDDLAALFRDMGRLMESGHCIDAVELAKREKRFSIDALESLLSEVRQAQTAVEHLKADCDSLGVSPINDLPRGGQPPR